MHVHVVQPALPAYRIDFFRRVADRLGPAFTVHYSPRDFGALTVEAEQYPWARPIGGMRRLGPGVNWQNGALSVPIARGDVVVVPGAPRELSNVALLIAARRRGAHTIWWGQYWSATSKIWRFALRRRLMGLADALLFYTDAEVAAYEAGRTRPDPRPVTSLMNGIDTVPIVARRAPYDAAARGRRLMFIGRLTDKTGFRLLLEALARPELADAHLDVIGDRAGQAEDEALKARARALGVAARVHWHGGTTDEERIAGIANRAALFVYPGAVGLSLIHAMAYGLPAVVGADRARHMPEIAAFAENETGRTFVPGDAGSLAAAIAAALDDAPALKRWSAAAVARTETAYNTRVMADRFCGLVGRLGR